MDNCELPEEAKALLSKMTLTKRQVKQMAEAVRNMGVEPALDIKNMAFAIFVKKHKEISTETQAQQALYTCSRSAYIHGYEDALTQYSGIVRQEIYKAVRAMNRAVNDKEDYICCATGETGGNGGYKMLNVREIYYQNYDSFIEVIGEAKSEKAFYDGLVQQASEKNQEEGRLLAEAFSDAIADSKYNAFTAGFKAAVKLLMGCMSDSIQVEEREGRERPA